LDNNVHSLFVLPEANLKHFWSGSFSSKCTKLAKNSKKILERLKMFTLEKSLNPYWESNLSKCCSKMDKVGKKSALYTII